MKKRVVVEIDSELVDVIEGLIRVIKWFGKAKGDVKLEVKVEDVVD